MSGNQLLQQMITQLRALERNIEQLAGQLADTTPTISNAPPIPVENKAFEDPYNTHAATLLAPVQSLIRSQRREIALFFYNHLRNESERILEQLTSEELDSLRDMQMHYLEKLFSPRLSATQHRQAAIQAGERHDAVSLPPEELAQAYQVYRRAIYVHIPELMETHQDAMRVIEHRLNNDQAWQMMGAMSAMERRNHHLKTISEKLLNFINRDDLLDFVLESLRELSGIVGASIAAFTSKNQLICEKAVGLVLHGQECTLDNSHPFRDRPLLQAWREGRPIWINSVTREIEDECLLVDAQQLGIRSYAIVPVQDPNEASEQLLLVIYSEWPGFFLSQDKQFFFESLARSLSLQVKHIEMTYHHHFTEITINERQYYRALLEDSKVEMVYQPIIDPHQQKVVKLESLARLIDDNGQFVPPNRFLPAFGTNQLLALFEQGLVQACETLVEIHEKCGNDIGISINLPTEAFEHPQVMYRIYGTVHSYGLPPHLISLEILESGALDENKAIQAIWKLKEHGFSIALDDVGSGESSMLRMKSLPLDEIKVDQGFVRPLLDNLDHLDYVDTLIRLAENLNLFCVVEGVENENIIDIICTLGDAYLQGYGIHKPMPRAELIEWINHYHTERDITQIDQSKGYLPKTLYGWYARHLKRARIILDALPNNIDLIHFGIAAHWDKCPLTRELEMLGLKNHPLYEAHQLFHDTVAELRNKLMEGQEPLQLKKQLAQVVQYLRQQVAEYAASTTA